MSEQPPDDPDTAASDEWLPAQEAHQQIVAATWAPGTNLAIAQRAHAGLLRARAQLFIAGHNSQEYAEVPKVFWWADGHEALVQNWKTGDFETWVNRNIHMRALGVSFHREDLRKCFPEVFKVDPVAPRESASAKGGRPAAGWWDDLWIEMCRALYVGDLKPQRQAEVEKAMNDWIATKGESAADSTVRSRARKLWQALSREDEN